MLFSEAKAQPILAVAERLGVRLVSSGRTVFTHCPDHRNDDGIDTHPSCALNPTTNRFRCFSCGLAGSAVDFVAAARRCSPHEAARWLTGQQELLPAAVLPGVAPARAYLAEMLEDLLALAGSLSTHGADYLLCRGIDLAIASRCRITDVADYAAVDRGLRKHYPRQDLVAAGVFSVKGHLRFFRHRLLLPSLSDGRAMFLTARRIGSNESPRYVNVNAPVELYNADALSLDDPVWITEGPIDCLTLASEGLAAVAVTGALIFKPAWAPLFAGREVVLALDSDDAGRAGSRRIAEMLRLVGASVRVAELPPGSDVNRYYLETGLVPHEWREE